MNYLGVYRPRASIIVPSGDTPKNDLAFRGKWVVLAVRGPRPPYKYSADRVYHVFSVGVVDTHWVQAGMPCRSISTVPARPFRVP